MTNKRILKDISEKHKYNAWDYFQFTNDQITQQIQKIKIDHSHLNSQNHKITDFTSSWNKFYKNHKYFFKNRKWLPKSYPFLFNKNQKILELGVGNGSSISDFDFENNLIIGIDCSKNAIEICKEKYPLGTFLVGDICKFGLFGCCYNTILLIFTLSAVHFAEHKQIFENVYKSLTSGGMVVFKDYGRGDVVHMRYKSEQIVDKFFYKRGDGTYTYFFDIEELRNMIYSVGFDILNLEERKVMGVNRKNGKTMFRVHIDGLFVKR